VDEGAARKGEGVKKDLTARFLLMVSCLRKGKNSLCKGTYNVRETGGWREQSHLKKVFPPFFSCLSETETHSNDKTWVGAFKNLGHRFIAIRVVRRRETLGNFRARGTPRHCGGRLPSGRGEGKRNGVVKNKANWDLPKQGGQEKKFTAVGEKGETDSSVSRKGEGI